MAEETYKNLLDDVLIRANEFLGYSVDKVIVVRESASDALRNVYDDLSDLRRELGELLSANDAVDSAMLSSDTSIRREGTLRIRAQFDERERELRSRIDDLTRTRVRLERILGMCTNTMGRLRLATEVVNNRIDTLNSLKFAGDIQNVLMGLQFAETENKRLAREIHDGPVQQFAAAILMFEYLERVIAAGKSEEVDDHIARIKSEMRMTLADLRGFLTQLQPLGLDMGLGHAIVRLAETYRERGVEFVTEISSEGDDLSSLLRTNIFRIVQEAVSNAVRHGGATRIDIRYTLDASAIELTVRDNGSGFIVDESRMMATERGSHGLENMIERVRLVDGTIHIDSGHGRGTEITLCVPLKREDISDGDKDEDKAAPR